MSTTPQRLDKYELQEKLGHGGIAEVWKAFDSQLQRFVAIKLLRPNLRDNPNFINRFKREAQLIASLHHPNIVNIHDFQVYTPGESEADTSSVAYMVMDYVEGQTLADYIHNTSSKGQIPSPGEIINLFTSISLAIDYAHQKGMIHRDIKPANILLDARNTTRNPMGEPILTDFGVAKLLSTSSNTMSGAQLGTPLYISPEQARGYPGNERSDLYSLGVILYEMLTGVTPFRGDTALDVISQHINATPTAPTLINPTIPPTLALVVMRSIAKDPSARFASASSMTAAVAAALNQPVPESLGQPNFPPDAEDMPTHLQPTALSGSSEGTPPILASAGPVSQGGIAGWGQPTPLAQSGPTSQPGWGTPNYTPVVVPPIPSQRPVSQPPYPSAPPIAQGAPPPAKPRRRRGLFIALIALVVLVLLGGGLSAYFAFARPGTAHNPPVAAASSTGRAFFVSSGQFNTGTAQGIADQMEIDLQNVTSPQPGNSYYAWLLADRQPDQNADLTGPRPIKPPLLLTNNLPVNNGSVHFFYKGDAQHNNLISTVSRLLIAEGPGGENPTAPPTDRNTWRYYGEIPQGQIPGADKGFTALVHIRHLFYNETNIKVLGLPGGLDNWLFKNTEKLVEYSTSARDDWHGANTSTSDIHLMNDLFIRILDYLDGSINVHVDLPPGTPLLTDPVGSKVSLLTVDPKAQIPANLEKNPPGYVDHIVLHVGQVTKATDITPEMRQTAASIIDNTNRAKVWLQNMRNDTLKLHAMINNPDQMKQASTGLLLDDMVNQSTYAYIGQLDPVTNQVKGGVLQAHYDIEQLAMINLTTRLPGSI
jgi:eukaryotic-like serine/threonine-protein kinase